MRHHNKPTGKAGTITRDVTDLSIDKLVNEMSKIDT